MEETKGFFFRIVLIIIIELEQLTLLSLSQIMESIMNQLSIIRIVIRTFLESESHGPVSTCEKTAHLLSILYETLLQQQQVSDTKDEYEVIFKLFIDSIISYLDIMDGWICEGNLVKDIYNEFMIYEYIKILSI